MTVSATGGLVNRLRTVFPDREFIMRSKGEVRFIRISSRIQIAAVASACALALWLLVMAALAISATRERLELQDREALVAKAEKDVSRYRGSLEDKAADLARRQDFIEKVVEAHLGDMPEDAAAATPAPQPAPSGKVGAALPEAGALARIEKRQLALVERLTRIADSRAEIASDAIRKVGLKPAMLLAAQEDGARGGPLLSLTTDAKGRVDPRFRRLGTSLARMSALERGLAGIPQVDPANASYISSGFGYRSDPFNGSAALHSGLDFAGPMGAPIYAAAQGVVSFAGTRHGYGNCIEIDHGNGLMTRYAHMSAFGARVGQKVAAGDRIGAIGSSGRSTGPHLHFEVRVNDQPVNPRPFLAAGSLQR